MNDATAATAPVFEVLPRDLRADRGGSVGVAYVRRFECGRPGPHVLINALTHGNEFCGMGAATHLLDRGLGCYDVRSGGRAVLAAL